MEPEIHLSQIMSTNLTTLCDQDSAEKLGPIFKIKKIHHLPIVDQEGGLIGIISQTDYERVCYGASLFRNPNVDSHNETLLRSLRVVDIMTKDVKTLRPTDNIHQAFAIFKQNAFRALPIVDKGRLVGMVTPLDLLDYFFQNQ